MLLINTLKILTQKKTTLYTKNIRIPYPSSKVYYLIDYYFHMIHDFYIQCIQKINIQIIRIAKIKLFEAEGCISFLIA
jgi:hypothetical protein